MKIIKAAVIGLGQIGNLYDLDPLRPGVNTHAGGYEKSPYYRLIAGVDPDFEKRQLFARMRAGTEVFSNYCQMLQEIRPEIVSVCTPSHLHREIAVAAMEQGVEIVFCEKPLAVSSAEVKEMIRLAVEKGAILLPNISRRWDLALQKAREIISSGVWGKIRQVQAFYVKGVYNTGSHLFDMLRYLVGEIESVAVFENFCCNSEDPTPDVVLRFSNGVNGMLQGLDVENYWHFEVRILCDRGAVVICNNGKRYEFYRVTEHSLFSGFHRLELDPESSHDNGLQSLIENALENIAHHVQYGEALQISAWDGYHALRLAEVTLESLHSGVPKLYQP